MFRKRRDADRQRVRIVFDGRTIEAEAGATVAAALLCNGVVAFRDPVVSGTSRGPHCMTGACFECLVEIDGTPGQQACLVPVREGMSIGRQAPLPAVAP